MDIYTPRCHVQRFTEDHIDNFMAYRNHEEWMKFQGFKGLSKEDYRRALLGPMSIRDGMQLAIVSTLTKALLGDIYLKREGDVCWVGYTIAPEKARQGYACEVVTAVMSTMTSQGILVMKAEVAQENTPSIRLLEKLSFTCIGVEDDARIFQREL